MKIFMKKLAWEFWPMWMMYLPMVIFWPYFMLRTKKIRFWELINPGLENGGLIGDSKTASLSQLPKKNIPRSITVSKNIEQKELLEKMNNNSVIFPCIVKPDSGMQGKGVKKINNKIELKEYFSKLKDQTYLGRFKKIEKYLLQFRKDSEKGNILIQNFIGNDKEFGVFYIRMPNEKYGKIVSLMERELPVVFGNSKDSLNILISKGERSCLYKKEYLKRHKESLNIVLSKNEPFQLGVIGNHGLGTLFIDMNKYISDDMSNLFDKLSKNISGFYYGRYDLKANSIDELLKGNFKVLEVNGANAGPTHMYDPKVTPLVGWGIIIKFWMKAFHIAMQNKKNTKL